MKRLGMNGLCKSSVDRPGAVLVGVIAALMVCTVMVSVALQTAIRGRREVRLEYQRMQVDYLCQAGIQHALGKLSSDAEYRGEIWLPSLENAAFSKAEVEITVEPNSPHDSPPDLLPATTFEIHVSARLHAATHNFGALQRSASFKTNL